MGELAAKIQHNTTLVTKLEETEQLMAERDKSIQELCDKIEAKERLIKSRDEVMISQGLTIELHMYRWRENVSCLTFSPECASAFDCRIYSHRNIY